jgi:hypothetical protein
MKSTAGSKNLYSVFCGHLARGTVRMYVQGEGCLPGAGQPAVMCQQHEKARRVAQLMWPPSSAGSQTRRAGLLRLQGIMPTTAPAYSAGSCSCLSLLCLERAQGVHCQGEMLAACLHYLMARLKEIKKGGRGAHHQVGQGRGSSGYTMPVCIRLHTYTCWVNTPQSHTQAGLQAGRWHVGLYKVLVPPWHCTGRACAGESVGSVFMVVDSCWVPSSHIGFVCHVTITYICT